MWIYKLGINNGMLMPDVAKYEPCILILTELWICNELLPVFLSECKKVTGQDYKSAVKHVSSQTTSNSELWNTCCGILPSMRKEEHS